MALAVDVKDTDGSIGRAGGKAFAYLVEEQERCKNIKTSLPKCLGDSIGGAKSGLEFSPPAFLTIVIVLGVML
jgi:hypothetical protein